MRKTILFLAALIAATVATAQVQPVNDRGAVINGPTAVIQKYTCGEFRNGEFKPFLKATQVRLELRKDTADGDILTVSTRHPWFRDYLYQFKSRDNMAIVGDDDSGYTVQDSTKVWLRLYPVGDSFVLDTE